MLLLLDKKIFIKLFVYKTTHLSAV